MGNKRKQGEAEGDVELCKIRRNVRSTAAEFMRLTFKRKTF